jgi:uncharacterized protein (TIGR03435 family)
LALLLNENGGAKWLRRFSCPILDPAFIALETAFAAIIAFALLTSFAFAQNSSSPSYAPTPDDPKFVPFVFDIASIKPADPATNVQGAMRWQYVADGFAANRVTVKWLVSTAYETEYDNISGGPAWFENVEYAMQARFAPQVADAFNKLSSADRDLARAHAFRVFLKERTNLAFHLTQKEVAAYALVIGKKGTRLKAATDPNEPGHGVTSMGADDDSFYLTGKAVDISSITGLLQGVDSTPILDKTGLTDVYDFTVRYKLPPPPGGENGQPAPEGILTGPATRARNALAEAIEAQLGLKLVPTRVTVNVIRIDYIDRPSAN